jgi:hypothetical protein
VESEFDISIEDGHFDNGEPAIALKLSNETTEVNVQLNIDEAHSLNRVLTLPEESRALLFGKCASSQVHWRRDHEKRFYLLIGHDDETWDVGITLSEATFSQIICKIEKHLQNKPMNLPHN